VGCGGLVHHPGIRIYSFTTSQKTARNTCQWRVCGLVLREDCYPSVSWAADRFDEGEVCGMSMASCTTEA
jgi:hypothetical protein